MLNDKSVTGVTVERELGNLPEGASVFKVLRQNAKLKFAAVETESDEDGGAMRSLFPVQNARAEWIGQTFGPGVYRLQWWSEVRGALKMLSLGKKFTIETRKTKPKKKPMRGAEVGSVLPKRPETELETFLRLREIVKDDYKEVMGMQRGGFEAQLERERLASAERIAQSNAYWQAMMTQKQVAAGPSETEMALRIELAKLQGRRAPKAAAVEEEEEEEDEGGGGAVIEGLAKLKDIFGPDVMEALGKVVVDLATKKAPGLVSGT